jgi:hypothetical protein
VLLEEVQVRSTVAVILVDLSSNGAQILSETALKPNRIVKLLLPFDRNPILCKEKSCGASRAANRRDTFEATAVASSSAVDEGAVETFLARRGVGPSRSDLVKTDRSPSGVFARVSGFRR